MSSMPLKVSGWFGQLSIKSIIPSPSESAAPPSPLPGRLSGQPSSSWNLLYCSFKFGH